MQFDHPITADNLPSPDADDCSIISSVAGCRVEIDWVDSENETVSRVRYGIKEDSPLDLVDVQTMRGVFFLPSGYDFYTDKHFIFTCSSSNSTPCNSVENLKRSMISTTIPTQEQIGQMDKFIELTGDFNPNACFQFKNMSNVCPEADLSHCEECFISVKYSQEINICATCGPGEVTGLFMVYHTIFLLNDRTHTEEITLTCRSNTTCNSMKNIEEIRKTLMSKFDFDKFFNTTTTSKSTKSTSKSFFVLLIIPLFIGFFYLF